MPPYIDRSRGFVLFLMLIRIFYRTVFTMDQLSLFDMQSEHTLSPASAPLADRMRPETLEDYAGQRHLLGEGMLLRRMLEQDQIPSMIFWGPPGVGKTTLARIIANTTKSAFFTLSAVTSGVKDVREVIERAQHEAGGMFSGGRPILFIDEIHRFSKSQQDSLLGAVENGTVTLIGATTENPSFEVIRPLLSRAQVYTLKPLLESDLQRLLQHAITADEVLSTCKVVIEQTDALFRYAGGDARKLLNILDLLQQSTAAFIKSIRGSDPDAAVYWLSRVIAGGEDPEFIARRMVILASEDIGLANPNAMLIANTTFDIIQKIGMPEGRIPLSECAIYLAQSPKSNSAYLAIDAALAEVEHSGNLPVPLHLRNAPTSLMKKLGYGQNYLYAHDYPGNFVQQQFLPDALAMRSFWHPCTNPAEDVMAQRTEARWRGFGKRRQG